MEKNFNSKPHHLPTPDKASWNRKQVKEQYLKINQLSTFARILLWLLSESELKRPVFMMISSMNTMAKESGSAFMVLYLKECHRLTMKAISGNPEVCDTLPRVATRRGLPLFIPGKLRLLIESKDPGTITLVLSVLTVYRVIKIPGVLKINTITDKFSGLVKTWPKEYVQTGLKRLRCYGRRIIPEENLLPSVKAGPNSKISCLGLTLDAYAFKLNPDLLESLKVISSYTGPKIFELLQKEIECIPDWVSSFLPKDRIILSDLKLGRLAKKEEAAGKIRVFAITDVWTQSVLLPLHNFIFDILRNIPMDGTFDQLKPLKALTSRGLQKFYSFDLSAATDRLPIDLQVQVLSELVNSEFAENWRKLLVSRPWFLDGIPYFYEVGQPMGALSSWGMLALTHHVLVQESARRVGWVVLFKDYAVLGDDIVIADDKVAKAYLSLCGELGVTVNLSKTLESEIAVAEFAKRLVLGETDVSPIPPKLVSSLLKGMTALPRVLRDMMSRGLSTKTREFVEVNRTEKKIKESIIWQIVGPLGFLPSLGISPFLGEKALSEAELRSLTLAVTNVTNRSLIKWFYEQQNQSQVLIDKIGTLVWDGYWLKNSQYVKSKFSHDTPAFHSLMDLFINRTIESNTTQPYQVSWEEGREYTFENVYNYITECVEYIDTFSPAVPDITEKSVDRPTSPNKMKFYRELEAELQKHPELLILSSRS